MFPAEGTAKAAMAFLGEMMTVVQATYSGKMFFDRTACSWVAACRIVFREILPSSASSVFASKTKACQSPNSQKPSGAHPP